MSSFATAARVPRVHVSGLLCIRRPSTSSPHTKPTTTTCVYAMPGLQVFTSIAKDVMQRLQQEQSEQQQAVSASPLKLPTALDKNKMGSRKKGCCDSG